jgi:hypothetical protein
MAGPLGVVVADVLAMSYRVRGSTGTVSTVTDFSASGSRVRGLLGLLTLGFLCTPSRRSNEVAERAAEPPILNRRCQLERRACPFFSEGGLESDDGVTGLSALAALLERLRRVEDSCEFLLYSSLSGTGGSTAPCPCGSLSLAAPDDDNDNDEGPRGTKGAASVVADDDDEEVVEAMRFGDGGSPRGLLRERALGWLWVAVCTNMAWLLPDARLFHTERGAIGVRHYAWRRRAGASMRISRRRRSGLKTMRTSVVLSAVEGGRQRLSGVEDRFVTEAVGSVGH